MIKQGIPPKSVVELSRERNKLLLTIERIFEGPIVFLGFIWLVILIIELIYGLNESLQLVATCIWIIFLLDFVVKFILAPQKIQFIKHNLLTIISLIIPALRIFRIFRVFRLLRIFRGTRLIKVIASLNRGMRSLNATMGRRGFGYVMLLTLVVILAGAAGMFAFENKPGGLESYTTSLWWTTMLVITVGSNYWPSSPEGRILCVLISLYGFAVFGYITATLASFFIGRDAEVKNSSSSASKEIKELQQEIRKLSGLITKMDAPVKKI